MKTFKLFLLFLFVVSLVNSQHYEITFTGTGESSAIDSIKVENLTQGISLTMDGNSVLLLTGELGLEEINNDIHGISVYPNPAKDIASVVFDNNQLQNINLEIFDVAGRFVTGINQKIEKGPQKFMVSGLPEGIFTLRISNNSENHSMRVISHGSCSKNPAIEYYGKGDFSLKSIPEIRSIKNEVTMDYEMGDILLFTGYSSIYTTLSTLIPVGNHNLVKNFVSCIDPDQYSYSTITIGDQIWMAENLRYLPAVSPPTEGSDYDSHFYVYGYSGTNVAEAKAEENYLDFGALYNRQAALNGEDSSSENPSGVRGICPEGWHLPSLDEWMQLFDAVGGGEVAAEKLKHAGHDYWTSPNSATNESGFSALPGGHRTSTNAGIFTKRHSSGYWWTASEPLETLGYYTGMHFYSIVMLVDYTPNEFGLSVRCIKD